MNKIFQLFILLNVSIGYSQCFIKDLPSTGKPLRTTGSKKLDKILGKEAKNLEKCFLVDVDLFAYDDAEFPNAYAVNKNPYTIILGKGLLLDEYVNTNGFYSILAIMAHEFAHVTQYKFNETLLGKTAELHADYLAGWYIGKKKDLSSEEINKISLSFWDKGDNDYFSADHHGTSAERRLAFLEGFKNSTMDIYDAYAAGKKHIQSMNIKENAVDPIIVANKDKENLNQCKLPNPIPLEIVESFRKGNDLYLKAKFAECATHYNSLIEKYPDYCVAYYNRGLALYYSGKEKEAILDFKRSYELGFLESKKWFENSEK